MINVNEVSTGSSSSATTAKCLSAAVAPVMCLVSLYHLM